MDYTKWSSKWKGLADPLEEEIQAGRIVSREEEAEACIQAAFARELVQDQPRNKLHELKVKMAVELYEQKRPADKAMHHYWIRDAGDGEAVGEYFPTGDERNGVPVYRNQHGLLLSREQQRVGPDTDEECYGWVLGNIRERRPLYGVRSDDLSAPTLGWKSFTAPEPMPVMRYYTEASAARVFKEKGNRAFQRRDWAEAEDWYSKALSCKMDAYEYAEALAMLLSNRAEVRLRLGTFEGATEDAASALQHLKVADSFEEPIQRLKQKTVVRLAKAQQSLKRFKEVLRLLQEQRRQFPKNQELERLLEETELAIAAESPGGRAAPGRRGAASEEMLGFAAKAVEALQSQVAALGPRLSDAALPQELGIAIQKLQYLLAKAHTVQGDCLSDLQAVVRTCGGLRALLQIVRAQWKGSLEGRLVDTFKFPVVAATAATVGLACEGCPENARAAAEEAPAFFAILGGCNRKVEAATCERLTSLVAGLWEHARAKSLELVQAHSIVVEKAASFLSQAVLAEPGGDFAGPDAPAMAAFRKEQAMALLLEWLRGGGRAEKRALRGAVPQLAGLEGEGLFSSEWEAARSLGELLARKAVEDPAVVSPPEVRNLLVGVNLLLAAGPGSEVKEQDMALISYSEYAGEGAAMRYLDLEAWASTEEGQHAALMLQVVAHVLEHRLLLKDRELEREDFEAAFHSGLGYFVTIPLVQAPLALAEPALRCLATLAQVSADNVSHIVNLSGINALFGVPSPDSKPMPSHVDHVLKTSAAARRHVAKLLSRCVETQAALELVQNAGERAIKELVKLATQVRKDGKGNLESFHDMLHVFFIISQFQPGPLCRHIPEDMMHLFVDLTAGSEQLSEVAERARAIVQMLLQDPSCARALQPIIQRHEEGATGRDLEDELLKVSDVPGALKLGR